MAKVTKPVRIAAGKRPMPSSRWKPRAAPRNSARSVAIAMTSACTHSPRDVRREKRSRQTSGRFRPVAMPSFAESIWISIAIRFDARITHASVKPNFEPPAMLVAKLPGSMYATQATKAGPRNGRIRHGRGYPRSACSAAWTVPAVGTVEQRRHAQACRATEREELPQVVQREAGVDHVLDQQHVHPGERDRAVLQEPDAG